jgi:hypothetical protein
VEVALAVPGRHGGVLGGEEGVEDTRCLQSGFGARPLTFGQPTVEIDESPQRNAVAGRPPPVGTSQR